MADVEAHRGNPSQPSPELILGERDDHPEHVLHSLEKRVSHGLQEGRDDFQKLLGSLECNVKLLSPGKVSLVVGDNRTTPSGDRFNLLASAPR
jgi:hypothetical protein